MNNLQSIKEELKNALRIANFNAVFDIARQVVSYNSSFHNEWLLIEGRFRELQRDTLRGIIPAKEKRIESQSISAGLLHLVNELTEHDLIITEETINLKEKKGDQLSQSISSENLLEEIKQVLPVSRIISSEIVRIIEELSYSGAKPRIHDLDLLGFGAYQNELVDFIRRFSILYNVDDIRRILYWRLNLAGGREPLSSVRKTEAEALYQAVFGQSKWLHLLNKSNQKLNIVLFRRGRNGRELTNLLKTLPFVNIQIIVSATDDGESWFHPARLFHAPGVPGIAKALVDLSEDWRIKEFMETRIHMIDEEGVPLPARRIRSIIKTLISYLNSPKPEVKIDSQVKVLYQKAMKIEKEKRKKLAKLLSVFSEAFDYVWNELDNLSYQSLVIRNIIFLGTVFMLKKRLKENEDDNSDPRRMAIEYLSKVLNIRKKSSIFIPNKRPHFLVAARQDGTIYFSEVAINNYKLEDNYELENPIIGLWIIEEIVDQHFINKFVEKLKEKKITKIERVNPTKVDELQIPLEFREQIKETVLNINLEKRDLDRALIEVFDIFSKQSLNYSTKGKVKENLVQNEVRQAIKNADIIITTNKRIETNSGGALLIPGMDIEIGKSKAIKIHLSLVDKTSNYKSNPKKDLECTYRYLRNNHFLKYPHLDWIDLGRYFDYVLIGTSKRSVYRELLSSAETIERETEGKTSAIVVDTSQNQEYGFYGSSVLIESIMSIYKCENTGFKIGNQGSLMRKQSDYPYDPIMTSIGLFRESQEVNNLISRLKNLLAEQDFLHYNGAFVFDIDMTILPKDARTLADYPEMAYLFMRLLREGVKVAIISGNSMEEQMKRIHEPIEKEMKGERSAFERLIFYVDGGSTKITFDKEGNPNLDHPFNKENNLSIAEYKKLLNPIIGELGRTQFGLSNEEVDEYVLQAQKKYKFKLTTSWKNKEKWEPEWKTPEELKNLEENDNLDFPWVEIRGKKNEESTAAFAIKPLPNIDGKNVRLHLLMKIREGVPKKSKVFTGIGGSSTIDISAGKTNAMKDLIRSLDLNQQDVYYFGDEFYEVKFNMDSPNGKILYIRGNDLELALDEGLNINTLAVNPISFDSKLEDEGIIWIGKTPQAVLEFVEASLISEDECISQ